MADWLHTLPGIKSPLPRQLLMVFFFSCWLCCCFGFLMKMAIYQWEKSGALCEAMVFFCLMCSFKKNFHFLLVLEAVYKTEGITIFKVEVGKEWSRNTYCLECRFHCMLFATNCICRYIWKGVVGAYSHFYMLLAFWTKICLATPENFICNKIKTLWSKWGITIYSLWQLHME